MTTMRKRIWTRWSIHRLSTAFLAFVIALCAPPAFAQVIEYNLHNTSVLRINLPQYQSATVNVSQAVAELAVGNAEIADAQPITDQTIYLVGNNLGRTTINLYSEARRPIGLIEVEVGVDTADIAASIRSVVPESSVHVSTVNGRMRLSGFVNDALAMQQVINVAAQYTSEPVINTIALKKAQQVNLEVRILEVTRDAGRELGINWRYGPVNFNPDNPNEVTGVNAGPGNSGGMIGGNVFNNGIGVITGGAPGSNVAGTSNTFASFITNVISDGLGFNLDIIINAMESRGLVRKLAEPNLTALSGENARFLAGGEVPIRVRDTEGSSTLQFKNFGVQLEFLPVVLSDDRIQIRLTPEVSELSGVTSAGDPIFATRNLESTIELRDGQSFSVAGLLQTTNRRVQNQLPWIGDIPVLGALFRSSSFQKSETELVVIVTPRLVRPSVPGQVAASPLDSTAPSNDAEFFLLGLTEVTRDMVQEFETGSGVAGPFGHIIETGQ